MRRTKIRHDVWFETHQYQTRKDETRCAGLRHAKMRRAKKRHDVKTRLTRIASTVEKKRGAIDAASVDEGAKGKSDASVGEERKTPIA